MQSKPGVVVAVAVLDDDVVANLPTDSVAVVIPGLDIANRVTITVLQKDTAGVISVEQGVVLRVAVEREIFDDHVLREFAGEQGKQGGNLRAARQPEILPQRLAEFEATSRPGDEGRFDDVTPPVVRISRFEADPVADLEPGRVCQSDFLVVPIRIFDELTGDRRALKQDRRRPAPDKPDARAEPNRIPHLIRARCDLHRSAPEACDRVDGGLDGLFGLPNDISFLLADGHRQPLVPFRLGLTIAGRRPRSPDQRAPLGEQSSAKDVGPQHACRGAHKRASTDSW